MKRAYETPEFKRAARDYHTRQLHVSIASLDWNVIVGAISHQAKPPDWRDSEYAITKATANRALKGIAAGCGITGFDLDCLLGELARAYQHTGELMFKEVFTRLRAQLYADQDIATFLTACAKVQKARRKAKRQIRQAKRVIKRASKKLK